jgi:hypothetical protein
MMVTEDYCLFCSICKASGTSELICHRTTCSLVPVLGGEPITIGHSLYMRGAPNYKQPNAAVSAYFRASEDLEFNCNTWNRSLDTPETKDRREATRLDMIAKVLSTKLTFDRFAAKEALDFSEGYIADARRWYDVWGNPILDRQEHDELVGICVAMPTSPHLPPYPLLWIVNRLVQFASKRELILLRLIERVQRSCARVRAARDNK